jgi:hypothetical protein
MEVMVSAVLVIVFATATLSVIEKSGQSSATTRQRGVAVGLAQSDQDSMRLMSLAQLTNRHVTANPRTIDGTDYVVQSDATWLRDAGGKVTCSANTTRAEYIKTTTKVTWTNHPAPVVMESYISPGVAGLAKGALTVKLKTDTGAPTSGIGVTAQGQTVITDDGGCAVFANLAPGPTTVAWDGTGPGNYVDRNGHQTPTELAEDITIGTGQTSQVERLFDHAGKIPVRFVSDATPAVPVNFDGVSVIHSGIQQPVTSVRSFGLASPQATAEATQLFPFATPYSLFAGECAGNAPTTWYPAATMPTAVAPAAAASGQVDVTVPTLLLWATQDGTATGTPSTNFKAVFKPIANAKMANCSGVTATVGSPATTPLAIPVPFGQYSVCFQDVGGTKHTPVRTTPSQVNVTPKQTTTSGETITLDPGTASGNANATRVVGKAASGNMSLSGACP